MDRSYASTNGSTKAERARIELLRNLHRPLEDHWAGNKAGLDANASDYVYKHHITRLEGIYSSTELFGVDNKAPIGPANVSPATMLYGNGGLLVDPEKARKSNTIREKKWDHHHNVVETMHACYERRSGLSERGETVSRSVSPSRPDCTSSSRGGSYVGGWAGDGHSRSSSPGSARAGAIRSRDSSPARRQQPSPSPRERDRVDSARGRDRGAVARQGFPPPTQPSPRSYAADGGRQRPPLQPAAAQASQQQQWQQQQQQERQEQSAGGDSVDEEEDAVLNADASSDTRYRCEDPNASPEELLLAGLYRFKPSQRHAYQMFVSMLVEHDTTDQLRIIEDAFKDAQVDSLLCNFSGT